MPETEEHVALQRQLADAGHDLTRIHHSAAKWVDEDDLEGGDELDIIVAQARPYWNPRRDASQFTVRVLRRFLRLCPSFNFIRTEHDTETDEFHWAWVRCLLASAGYAAHAPLAAAACELYPQCPLNPDESFDDWMKALDNAHQCCGWPVTAAILPWTPMFRALKHVDCDDFVPKHWMRVLLLLHMLKHTRVEYGIEEPRLCVAFGGVCSYTTSSAKSSLLSEMRDVNASLRVMLGLPGNKTGKTASPFVLCWQGLMSRLTISSFLPRVPISRLPGFVLAGPWSACVPSVSPPGFTQTGLRLDGVWVARDGRIDEYHGDDEDVITYAWNCTNPATFSEHRTQFENQLPQTYTVGDYPADVWAKYFPNLDTSWLPEERHKQAYRALIDSVMLASFLRGPFKQLDREKPMILCFPMSPEIEACTNQGKTTAAMALTRAMVPGITQPISMMANNSAPDQRAFAQQILRHGTACIDEWFPSAKDGHVLSNRNLQSIMTGGLLTIGMAGENAPGISINYSLTASCKAGDFPPDLINRVIACFLDQLPAEAKAGEGSERLNSGIASLEIRLSALAYLERHDMTTYLRTATKAVSAWRYPWHMAIANHVYAQRTGEESPETMLAMVGLMQERLRSHAARAEETGLLAQLREGVTITFTPMAFFEHLTDVDIQELRSAAEPFGKTIGNNRWLTPSSLIRGRKHLLGTTKSSALLEALTGQRASITDRSMVNALRNGLCAVMRNDEVFDLRGTSYAVYRASAEDEAAMGSELFRINPREPARPATI